MADMEQLLKRNCSLEMSIYHKTGSYDAVMPPVSQQFQSGQLMSFACGQNPRQSLFASTDREDLCIALMNY